MASPELQVVISGYNRYGRNMIDKHYDRYIAVHFTASGRFSLNVGNRRWDLDGAWLWTGYPGPRYRFGTSAPGLPWEDYYFGIAGALPRHWLADGLLPRRPRAVPASRLAAARAAADELLGLRGAGDGLRGRIAANLFERLLLLVAEDPQPGSKPDWFTAIVAQATGNPAWQPDWDALAKDCGMPPSTFRKRFQRLAGHPPQRWLIDQRITAARDLLDAGHSVAAVAERLGYGDPYFFSRQFHTWAGLAPSVYARGEGS